MAQEPEGGGPPGGGGRRRRRYPGSYPRLFAQRYKERDPEKYPGVREHVRERGMTPAGTHVPVLLGEVVEALRPAPGEAVLDCTVGFGGHALELARRVAPGGILVGLDADESALQSARSRLEAAGSRSALLNRNFESILGLAEEHGLGGFDVIFADLGVSSMQLDDPERGFSFKFDGPLDMRMDRRLKRTAADLIASMTETGIAEALAELADEEDAGRIARAIAAASAGGRITGTRELARIVLRAKGVSGRGAGDGGGAHPAAKTFMAFRIMVNRELDALRRLLQSAPLCLRPGGRIGIISFHSGEHRIVKRAFGAGLDSGAYREASEEAARPSRAEIRSNPRSAPARLRRAVKAGGPAGPAQDGIPAV